MEVFDLARIYSAAENIKNARADRQYRNDYLNLQREQMQGKADQQAELEHYQQKYALWEASAENPALRSQILAEARRNDAGGQLSGWDDATLASYIDHGLKMKLGIKDSADKRSNDMQLFLESGGDPRDAAGFAKFREQEASRKRPLVEVNTGGRKEKETVETWFGDQYGLILKAGYDASNKMNKYTRISQLLEGVSTGKFTNVKTELAATARAFGLEIDPALDQKQAARSLLNQLALEARNPSGGACMPGAMSDKDREYLTQIPPNLENTPEANRLILDTLQKLAQRDRDVAKMAREYRAKHGGLDEGFFDELERFANQNPLFDTQQSTPGGETRREVDWSEFQQPGGQ